MAASIPRSRLLELTKLQCSVFSQTFNPQRQRLGNKVLRQRLRGPTVAAYYPRKSTTIGDMLASFDRLGLIGVNEAEGDRLESVAIAKMRGKGPPKKSRVKKEKGGKKKGGKR